MDEDSINPAHSPVRHILAQVHGGRYIPLKGFDEAKTTEDAVVILEGDWGGQIYLVCPMTLVNCREEELQDLLRELDRTAWPCNEGEGTGIYYEQHSVGQGIAGGMGGGVVTRDLWVHPKLRSGEKRIRQVLMGAR